ncbi:MAG: aminotransferase class III-fold pyridoxal phosphate-dependent enzyme [Sandaracinaceae bacterium]
MSEPFFHTWTAQRGVQGLPIVGGEGAVFHTADGQRWLDFGSRSYQASLGHGCRPVIDAVRAQADRLCLTFPRAMFPEKRALAEKLLELSPPGFTKVFFTLGGAEANENALKMARLVTGRHKVLSRYRSYHGATMGALSLTGDFRRPPLEPGLVGAVKALDCYCDRCPFGQLVATCRTECASHIEDVLRLDGGIGAVFVEAVPGANGVLVPPPTYLPGVREACDRHGALLVADEVLTGFGRTGRCFAFEHWEAVPDLITVSKALTGGYGVLGAVMVHERVAAHFEEQVLYAGLTHYAHPLGVAAGLAAIGVMEREGLVERSARLGATLLARLRRLAADRPELRLVRGLGLLAALELDLDEAAFERFVDRLRARRLFVHARAPERTVVLAPPLVVREAELEEGLALLVDALEAGGKERT